MTTSLPSHLDRRAAPAQLADDVRAGLTATPKTLPPKYFYDARGSELFDEITRLPGVLPDPRRARDPGGARAEIARGHRRRHAGRARQRHLGEDPAAAAARCATPARCARFVPFDVDPAVLQGRERRGRRRVPRPSRSSRWSATSSSTWPCCPASAARLVAFLGSTIGNLEPRPRARRSCADVRATLRPGDAFLLGTDLVKDADRLVAAYDDAAGVTARVQQERARRGQPRARRRLRPRRVRRTSPCGTPSSEWIEMRLRSRADQRVHIAALDLDVPFAAGEEMRTEISAKFRRGRGRGRARRRRAAASTALVDRRGRRLRALALRPGLRVTAAARAGRRPGRRRTRRRGRPVPGGRGPRRRR